MKSLAERHCLYSHRCPFSRHLQKHFELNCRGYDAIRWDVIDYQNMTESLNDSRIKGTVWLSGQLGADMSLREVLEMIGTMPNGKLAILRILSKSVKGYVGIKDSDTITGAQLTSTRDFGLPALRALFAAEKGLFLIMIMNELPIELRQELSVSIKWMLQHAPQQSAADALELFSAANPQAFALNANATAAATSGKDLVDFESFLDWGESKQQPAPKMTLSKITTQMSAPKAEDIAASRAAVLESMKDETPPPLETKPASEREPQQKTSEPEPQQKASEPEPQQKASAPEPQQKLSATQTKLLRRVDGIHRDDAQSMSQKIRALRDDEAHKLAPLEDYFDDMPEKGPAPVENRKVTVMSFVYGGVATLLLLALGQQVFNVTQAHAQFRSGLKSLASGDDARAEVELSTALKLGGKGSEPYLYRSIAEDRLGHSDKALSDLNQLIAHSGSNKIARITRATMLLKKKDFASAIADCDEILKQDDTYLDAYRVKAIAQCGSGDYKQCIDDASNYLRASEKQPNLERSRAEVLATQAFAYLKVKKYEQAIADYTAAIALTPNNPHLYASRAVAYTKTKQWKEGLDDVDAAIKADPSNSALYKLRGICYREAGKLELAAQDMNTAAKMKPSLTSFRLRGDARLAAKDYVGALEDFEYLLSVNPNDKEAKQKFDAAKLALLKAAAPQNAH
jgi:tetratricopeptide (TPR) repeat protein